AHTHELVSAPVRLESRQALSSEAEDRLGLNAGRNSQSTRAVHRGYLDLGPEHGIGHRNRKVEHEIISVPDKPIVGLEVDSDVEVARRRTRLPREAAAGNPELDAVRDSRGNFHGNRPGLRD